MEMFILFIVVLMCEDIKLKQVVEKIATLVCESERGWIFQYM